jgi:KDO2-lipid IV(A) lauroyltransferase
VRASAFVRVSAESEAVLARVLARRQGAIFLTAHLGPFELVAARIAELGHPSAVVVRESYDPRLDSWVDAHRIGRGLEVIHRGHAGASFRIVRALRRGLAVGFLPDLATRGVASVEVDFLGLRVRFPKGPQEIALRLGAPVVVGALAPVVSDAGPRFELEMTELDAEPKTANVEELTQRVASALEKAIARSPADWLWMARTDSDPKTKPAPKAERAERAEEVETRPPEPRAIAD